MKVCNDKVVLSVITILSLLIIGCSSDQTGSAVHNISNGEQLSSDLIVYKKEKQLELWVCDPKDKCIKKEVFNLTKAPNWPLGVFKWTIESPQNLVIDRSSSIYSNKSFHKDQYEWQLTTALDKTDWQQLNSILSNSPGKGKLIILPNDFKKDGYLSPCVHCPHWMTEVYAQMELESIKYQ